jgi:Domain of unknown function (DUF929)
MAQDQENTNTGGNRPKPASNGQSAKDRSKAQSRPVSAKAPTGKSGKAAGAGGKGGNTPRPGAKVSAPPPPRKMTGAMMAWGAVGLVIIVVAVLVIVKVTSSSTPNLTYTPVTPAPASVVHDVTDIPLSVYNTVGVNFPAAAQASAPVIIKNQPPLSLDGKSPAMLYYGAEYCPFCAAERWSITAALSRFGKWSNLQITASSHTDTDANTHTFSYHGATFTSPYLTFRGVEVQSNVPLAGGGYTSLESPTKQEQAVIAKYSGPTFISGATPGQVSFPFINIGNIALISGATYSPAVLAGLTWTDIAANLTDTSNPATQSIVAAANVITASICASTKGNPGSVCTSSGVQAAAKALKLS